MISGPCYNTCIMDDDVRLKDFDRSVKPAGDFFRFVNQKWISENPIPPGRIAMGSFYVLRSEVERQIKEILEALDAESGTSQVAPRRERKYAIFIGPA